MTESSQTDQLLIDRIRAKEPDAWNELIARFEGRLLAFVRSRANSRPAAEDIVQETFIGFLTSLPNYDKRRSLESYLFSIAAHKLTDHLRREGRRPTSPLVSNTSGSGTTWDQPGNARPASSILRSDERRHIEEGALVDDVYGRVGFHVAENRDIEFLVVQVPKHLVHNAGFGHTFVGHQEYLADADKIGLGAYLFTDIGSHEHPRTHGEFFEGHN